MNILLAVLLMLFSFPAQQPNPKLLLKQNINSISQTDFALLNQVQSWKANPGLVAPGDLHLFNDHLRIIAELSGDSLTDLRLDTAGDLALNASTKARIKRRIGLMSGEIDELKAALPKIRESGTQNLVKQKIDELSGYQTKAAQLIQ